MSDAIDLMMEEHQLIKRALHVIRKLSWQALQNSDVNYQGFAQMIDFVRSFADKHHHSKEEDILFTLMGEDLGESVSTGPVTGMLIEHDLGRQYISGLEESLNRHKKGDDEARLDIIANAVSYTHLLHNHIEREDMILYEFARRSLSKEAKEELNRRCRQVEENMAQTDLQEKYRQLVDQWESVLA